MPLRDSAFELYPLSRARLTTRSKCIKMRFSPRSTHSLLIKAKRGLHSLSRRQGALILLVAVYIATLCHSVCTEKDSRWCFGVREWIHRSASSLRVDDTAYRPGSQEGVPFPLGKSAPYANSRPEKPTRWLRHGQRYPGPLDSGKYQS